MKNTYKLTWSDEALKRAKKRSLNIWKNKFPRKKDVKKFAKKLDKQLDLIKKVS